jgi:murein DD-endopeptidase MepM/ murein hydrolase activator NlpD
VAVVAALVVGACDVRWLKNDSTKTASSTDSVTISPVVVTAVPNPGAMPLDTLVGLAFGDSEVARAVPAPVVPKAAGDTSAAIATPLELEQLRVALDVPVEGVARSQLRDNFSEARSGHSHEALDIAAPRGTPVLSATDGRVVKLFESKAGGHMVYAADASDRFILMYAHLDRYAPGLQEGMPLRRGQLIGYVGTSGNAPADTPHLHFAIARGRPSVKWWKGTPVNPYPLLAPEVRARGGGGE